MPDRQTEEAVAEAAPLETARRAAGARGAGSRLTDAGDAERRRLAVDLGPRLDAIAAGIDLIRRELHV